MKKIKNDSIELHEDMFRILKKYGDNSRCPNPLCRKELNLYNEYYELNKLPNHDFDPHGISYFAITIKCSHCGEELRLCYSIIPIETKLVNDTSIKDDLLSKLRNKIPNYDFNNNFLNRLYDEFIINDNESK